MGHVFKGVLQICNGSIYKCDQVVVCVFAIILTMVMWDLQYPLV